MTYYVFGIGGTGARCLESLIYLCAMGLGPERLHPILVDPDTGNGNLRRARELIIKYKEIRDTLDYSSGDSGSFFSTNVIYNDSENQEDAHIQIPNVFNPNSGLEPGMNTLRHFIEYDTELAASDGKYLADLLFSSRELDMDMEQGYRGVPSIGSVLMTNVQTHSFWPVLKDALQNDPDSKVFIFASVFGGTGASGYPVISQLLKTDNPTSRIGGALLLPYFKLPDPKNLINQQANFDLNEILPDSNSFMLNAKAACEFYRNNFAGNDSNYALGDDLDKCKQYENYAPGRENQKNDAHMIELMAAYAAMDFWEKSGDNYKDFYEIQVHNPAGDNPNSTDVIASDLPHSKKGLPFERFALLFHYVNDIFELMEKPDAAQLDKIAWLRDLGYRGKDAVRDRSEIKPLVEFCGSFKNWIKQTHANRAKLDILDPELMLTCLVSENKVDYSKPPVNRIDTKIYGKQRRKTNLAESLLKALSQAKIEKRGK